MDMDQKPTVTDSSENAPVSSRTRSSHKPKTEEEPCHLSDQSEGMAQETTDSIVEEGEKSYNENKDKGVSKNGSRDNSSSPTTTATENQSYINTEEDSPHKATGDDKNEINVGVNENSNTLAGADCSTNVRKRHGVHKETHQIKYETISNRNENKHAKTVEHIGYNSKHINSNSKFRWYVLCTALIAVVSIVCYCIMRSAPNVEERSDKHLPTIRYQQLYDMIELVKMKYPKQSQRFWRIIKSQFKRLITENTETYPAVIMIVIPIGQSQVGMCLAVDIIQTINKMYNGTSSDAFIDLSGLKGESAAKRKHNLDKILQAALNTNKGVLLDHLEVLDSDVALLLHGYCDGDNAPFKSSAMFFGLHTNRNSSSLDDMSVSDMLTELWQDGLGKDEFPALMSRIANNIAIVENEDNFKCSMTKI